MSNQVNLYGGRRNGNNKLPYFKRSIIRKIVFLIIQLIAIYHLNNAILEMSLRDHLNVRKWTLKAFGQFIEITKTYFVGYQRGIEATASAMFAVVTRKLQTGRGLSITNIPVATTSFALTYALGTGVTNFVRNINRYNNSTLGKITGRTVTNALAVQKVIITMICWLIASLKNSSITVVAEITNDVMAYYHLRTLNRRNMLKFGNNKLKIKNVPVMNNLRQSNRAPLMLANGRQSNGNGSNRQSNGRQTVFRWSSPNNNAARRQARARRFT